ncbi:hypothetical protein LR003_01805 [candidate division NPL-UPA2 bacterium]|nr:hypothetical protein [candidate division NPL-UPA2 bacterium]
MTYKVNLHGREAESFWSIVENFYTAGAIIGNKYGKLMGARKTSPEDALEKIALSSPTIGFKKLEALRDSILYPLKEASHELFRDESTNITYPFDKYISDIFHEVSIVKEEAYQLIQIGDYQLKKRTGRVGEKVEKRIVLKAKKDIAGKMRNIHTLFREAETELVILLKQQNRTKSVIRSLYLSAEEIFGDKEGLEILYEKIYDLGAFEGYLTVAESFYESRHDEKAREAFYKAREKEQKLAAQRKTGEGCKSYQKLAARYQKLGEVLK